MKVFSYFKRKLEVDPTEINAVEVWCVRWRSLYREIGDFYHSKIQIMAFIEEQDAIDHKNQLIASMRLLGDNRFEPDIYKQEPPSN